MRLTAHILDQISWWEHSERRGWTDNRPYDRFVLHFKAWWRPRKVLTMGWRTSDIRGDIVEYNRSRGAEQLLDQLNTCLSYPGTKQP